jgi:hypothetical protein
VLSDRFLLGVASALMTLGVAAIVVGWLGASDSVYVEEQIPYLISGGQLGLALAVIGSQCFFAYWLTVSIRENRAHEAARRAESERLIQQLEVLTGALTKEQAPSARTGGRARPIRPRQGA